MILHITRTRDCWRWSITHRNIEIARSRAHYPTHQLAAQVGSIFYLALATRHYGHEQLHWTPDDILD